MRGAVNAVGTRACHVLIVKTIVNIDLALLEAHYFAISVMCCFVGNTL